MTDSASQSPYSVYAARCREHALAYQVRTGDQAPVFHPRLVAPGIGGSNLEWRVSVGNGTVYATTTLFRRGEAPYNVALIDLDEGFRMMSRVEGIEPAKVAIGMRVRVRFVPAGEPDAAPVPVFVPVDPAAAA